MAEACPGLVVVGGAPDNVEACTLSVEDGSQVRTIPSSSLSLSLFALA